jgi:hypothetical protein
VKRVETEWGEIERKFTKGESGGEAEKKENEAVETRIHGVARDRDREGERTKMSGVKKAERPGQTGNPDSLDRK